MNRRNFIKSIFGAVAAIPLVKYLHIIPAMNVLPRMTATEVTDLNEAFIKHYKKELLDNAYRQANPPLVYTHGETKFYKINFRQWN